MKRLSLFAIATLFVSLASQARVLTVSNNSARPAMYTTIATALSDAYTPSQSNCQGCYYYGDTIMVYAGTYQENLIINKQVIIYGEGSFDHTPSYSSQSFIDGKIEFRTTASYNPFGTELRGIVVENLEFDNTMDSLTFERVRVVERTVLNSSASNIHYINCMLYAQNNRSYTFRFNSGVSSISGFRIDNCVFDGDYGTYTERFFSASNANLDLSDLKVRNCLFVYHKDDAFANINGMVIERSIFYGVKPLGCTNCTFNDNLLFQVSGIDWSSSILSNGLNNGINNLVGDPLFTAYANGGTAVGWSTSHDFHSGQSFVNSNSIGLEYGQYPAIQGQDAGGNDIINLRPNPRIPVITNLYLQNTSIPQGGSLQIQLQARTRN